MASTWRARALQERMARALASGLRPRLLLPRAARHYPCPPDSRTMELMPFSESRSGFFSSSCTAERHVFLKENGKLGPQTRIGSGTLLHVHLAVLSIIEPAYGSRGLASGAYPPHEVITMPALSPTMTQGNVGKWKKKEGDQVAAGEVLCDIETDKATLDLECMEDGVLAKILIQTGTKDVAVGKALCVVAESEDNLSKFADYSAEGASSGGGQAAAPQQQRSAPTPPPPQTSAPPPSEAPPPSDLPPHQVLSMPALSPTMTQGNVGKWKKKEGDTVAAGDVLCDIETDKATLDFESLEDGILAKILIPADTKDVPVGKALCIVAESGEDMGKFASYSGGGGGGASRQQPSAPAPQSSPAPSSAPPPRKAPPADLPPHQVLSMPALSPTMTQGNVGTWKKKEGDTVAAGDALCDIETDKATLDFESLEDGFVAKILIPSGTKDVQVGRELCIIAESNEELGKFASYSGGDPAPAAGGQAPAPSKRQTSSTQAPAPAPMTSSAAKGKVGPSVRKYLAESGLDASQIQGTGPKGMLLKGDVLAAMKGGVKPQGKKVSSPGATKGAPSKAPVAAHSELTYEDIPNSQIRKIIAKRLLDSKNSIPHAYLESATYLDPTLQLRKELKEKHGISVSVNDFVIRAAALALKEVPEANSFWDEKVGDRVSNKSIDICVAVATDKGLMTPILKNADQKSLSAISSEVKSLAERARSGKLKPHEFQGGTFSISNLGMFQVDHFCAIINPPQACILAVGRGEKVVIWEEDPAGGGRPKTVTQMLVTLSVDHRVYDGDTGGRFLKALRANLFDPKRMLL